MKYSEASSYFNDLIENIFPDWLNDRNGVLQGRWKASEIGESDFLMEFAELYQLLEEKLLGRSAEVFKAKFISLLKTSDERIFEDIYCELRVAYILINCDFKLELEPLSGDELCKNPSPDIKAIYKDQGVFIEVTVLRVGLLKNNEDIIKALDKISENKFNKFSHSVILNWTLPLFKKSIDPQSLLSREVISQINAQDKGKLQLTLKGYPVILEWEHHTPYITADLADKIKHVRENYTEKYLLTTSLFSSKQDLEIIRNYNIANYEYEQIAEAVSNSLIHTIDRKRKDGQFPDIGPCILVIKHGGSGFIHRRLRSEGLFKEIESRIWNNPKYKYLCAIGNIDPNLDSNIQKELGNRALLYTINPKTEKPLSSDIVDKIKNKN